jgi:hypothetical protein
MAISRVSKSKSGWQRRPSTLLPWSCARLYGHLVPLFKHTNMRLQHQVTLRKPCPLLQPRLSGTSHRAKPDPRRQQAPAPHPPTSTSPLSAPRSPHSAQALTAAVPHTTTRPPHLPTQATSLRCLPRIHRRTRAIPPSRRSPCANSTIVPRASRACISRRSVQGLRRWAVRCIWRVV